MEWEDVEVLKVDLEDAAAVVELEDAAAVVGKEKGVHDDKEKKALFKKSIDTFLRLTE